MICFEVEKLKCTYIIHQMTAVVMFAKSTCVVFGKLKSAHVTLFSGPIRPLKEGKRVK